MGVSYNPQGDYQNILGFSYSGIWKFRTLLARSLGFNNIADFISIENEHERYDKLILKRQQEKLLYSFVYRSDCEGSFAINKCRRLWTLLRTIDLDRIDDEYDRYDIEQLIKILKICIDTKTILTWN